MNYTMEIEGHIAIISFDPDAAQFRGEFTGLNGGVEFYGASVDTLRKEVAQSLQTFLAVCKERGIESHQKQ